MSTAFARTLGTTRHLHANGRTWTVEKSGGERMLCEVTRDDIGLQIMPGHWAGLPRRGFSALDLAGYWRRRVAQQPEYRMTFLERARDALYRSREMRVTHERLTEAREVYAMHAEAA